MKSVIVGGTGLIGRALTALLISVGHDVTILTRHPEAAGDLALKAKLVRWDGKTPGEWTEAISGADAVVNLAGENLGTHLWTRARKERLRRSRLDVGALLADAIAGAPAKPGMVVQASAIGYYGPRDNTPIDETAPAGQGWLAQMAVAWENATEAVEALGVRRVVIRTGLVLARNSLIMSRLMLPFHFYMGGRLGSGRQTFSWIHIHDEVRAIQFLIEHPTAAGAFNLTAPHPVTNATFSRALGRAMHRPPWFPVPGFALRLVLGEMSQLVLTGQHVLPKRLHSLGFRFTYPHLDDALTDLLP